MSTRRVSGSKSRTSTKWTRSKDFLKSHGFIGVNLGGGKSDRTSVAVLKYYPDQKKIFLSEVYDHIGPEGETSSDQILYELVNDHRNDLEYLCLNAPLKFPKCIRCQLKCPGYEKCKEPEIQWMWKQRKKNIKNKPRARLFTPYTQRAAEVFVAGEVDAELYPNEALGANIAPLTARAHFLLRRLKGIAAIEIFPKLSLLKIGLALKISKHHLLNYKHSVTGEESRQLIMQNLVNRDLVFIYHQDLSKLIQNPECFEAFLSAYTGFLKFTGQCEKPPKDFPRGDGWIELPNSNLNFE